MTSKNSSWEINPIIVKELRSRMRGPRAFITITASLLFLALVCYALYRVTSGAMQNSTQPLSPLVGQVLFFGLILLEVVIAAAIAPSVTASAISSERERETYEMLLATPLRPATILWGKLVASMGYVFLILFAAIPMAGLVFLFGGVTLRDMLKAFMMLFVVAIMFGMIGLFLSTVFGRSGRATAVAAITTLGMLFVPTLAAVGIGLMRQTDPPRWLLAFSPLSAVATAMAPSVNANTLSGMFWSISSPIYWIMGAPQMSIDTIPRPLYHYSLPLFLGITVILYMLASHYVRPHSRWRVEWAELLVGGIVLIALLGATGLGYVYTANRYENIVVNAEEVTPEPAAPTVESTGPAHPVLVPEVATPTPGG